MTTIPELPSPFEEKQYITFGVDAGLRYTGVAWRERGVYKVVQVNNTCPEFSLVPLTSAEAIVKTIKDIASGKKIFLVIEDFAFGGTFNAQQGEMIGALKYLIKTDKQFKGAAFLAPNTAKKLVTGSGKATKGKVKKAAETISSQKLASSHVADAVAILYSYQQVYDKPSASMYRRAMIKN